MTKHELSFIEKYEPMIHNYGYEFANVEIKRSGRESKISLFIDRLDRERVGIEDCETISRLFDEWLDTDSDFDIQNEYILEVSSPGIERALVRKKDFERFIGSKVQVKTFQAINGRKEHIGILTECDDDSITLGDISISFSDITKANLYVDF